MPNTEDWSYWTCDSVSVDHPEYGGCGDWVEGPESDGLGFPSIADRIEYSRLAASDPNAKLGSNGILHIGSFCGNGSAGNRKGISGRKEQGKISLHVAAAAGTDVGTGAVLGSELLSSRAADLLLFSCSASRDQPSSNFPVGERVPSSSSSSRYLAFFR